jgi:hypothetical protein
MIRIIKKVIVFRAKSGSEAVQNFNRDRKK